MRTAACLLQRDADTRRIAKTHPALFLLLDPAAAYDAALLRGVADFASLHGQWRIFRPPPFWEGVRGFDLPEYIRRCRPDAMLLIEQDDMRPFHALGLPMVVSPYRHRKIKGAVNLETEHRKVGAVGGQHLLNCGFRHLAFCGYRDMFWSEARRRGFQAAVQAAGRPVDCFDPPPLSTAGFNRVESALADWLRKLPKPVGIMTGVDARAWQLAGLCSELGLRVPDDVGILGVDNDELLCTTAPTPLSSVAITARQAGFDAAQTLYRIVTGKLALASAQSVTVRPSHVEGRASTDFLNLDDPAMVKALRLIRSRPREPLDVETVARHVGLSRRSLEKKFRGHLDRTVSAEIRRVRAEAFADMLRKTNLSVGAIAERFGFSGPEHVSRFFKKEKGLSPLAYRQSLK